MTRYCTSCCCAARESCRSTGATRGNFVGRGFHIGGLLGGIASAPSWKSLAWMTGGAGAGFAGGYYFTGDVDKALMYANYGMMVGAFAGSLHNYMRPSPLVARETGMWAYSMRSYHGPTLDAGAGGFVHASIHAPGPWATSYLPYYILQRMARIGHIRAHHYSYKMTPAQIANMQPIPLNVPTNILWKHWAGQFRGTTPGDMVFSTGIIKPPSGWNTARYLGNQYGEWALMGGLSAFGADYAQGSPIWRFISRRFR